MNEYLVKLEIGDQFKFEWDQLEFEGSYERKSETPVFLITENQPWHWSTRWVKVNAQEKLTGPCYNQDDIRPRDSELASVEVGRRRKLPTVLAKK